MIQRFAIQLPPWARLEHPVLRYGLGRTRILTRRSRYARAALLALIVVGLTAVGYLIATNMLQRAPGQHFTESLAAVVFWPVIGVQLAARLVVYGLTVNTVNDERRRQTWDSVRSTENGIELMLRTRWAGIFYRLREVLGGLIVVRVVLIGGILFDLTAFRGGYLDRLINGVTPEVSVPMAVVLLSLLMTASILLPLTGLGLDAALGLLISTVFQERLYMVIAQIVFSLARVALLILLLAGTMQYLNGELVVRDGLSWLLVGGFAAMGDWGISLLHLGAYGEIWATVPFGIFIGPGLLVFALVQAMLTDWILALAIRRADLRG